MVLDAKIILKKRKKESFSRMTDCVPN